jgi:RHS repeat-associated protein
MTAPGDDKTAEARKGAQDKNSLSLPAISLPKGGGAIRGMGEKFGANPVTGTGSLSVPIFATPSRAEFCPKLTLSYDSGAGNGPFGFGWHLSVPMITRKTDKGLPRYRGEEASDVFILSDAEDLVPALIFDGTNWIRDSVAVTVNSATFTVQRYRPRVEGLFARIECWRNDTTGDTFWKSVSKDNVTSLYGTTLNSRIRDPNDSSRVFTWLLETSYDDKGNVITYEYKSEDRANVPLALYEVNRQIDANRYLKRIHYGNRTPYYPNDGTPLPTDWCFQIVLDYGEHDSANPRPDEVASWRCRLDPFSSYRAGFEVRTYRVCSRILMFHTFPEELGPDPYLVRSTDFTYSFDEQPTNPLNTIYTFIASVRQVGYIKKTDGTGYDADQLPPLEFDYTQVAVDETIHFADGDSLENLPYGVDGAVYQWIDLDSEGLPGILTEQASGWFYKRNVSNLPRDGDDITARFEPSDLVATKPSLADLRGGAQQLMDLAGDGQLSLVQFAQPRAGFYERDENASWQPFTPFTSSPNIDWSNPNLRTIDLDGDGHADILITEDQVFTWYRSLAQEGFSPAEMVPKPFDEDLGPALVFADGTQSIYLADLSGDGLTDIARIRNGEVCYWPNLGYGRFGAKITMDNAPYFDSPDLFDQKRIRLADIDGSGTTDILYLGREKVTFWLNQSGNSWSPPNEIPQFPATDDVDSVGVVDLLGNGTACLVWSSPLLGDVRRPMRYIDLMGGQKPHLLISVTNNLGAETRIGYAASTKFYLQDRAAGNPWLTKLPFPVHVVERVEAYDYVSGTKLVSLYTYHHGYFDGIEREFRGFGMVEQWDTESFSKYSGAGLFTRTPEVEGEEFHLPPVHTKTWFHTGAFVGRDNISQHFAEEYFQGDSPAALLPDGTLPDGLNAQGTREAARSLKGRILRQEIYADDDSPNSPIPYSATEHTYSVRPIQPLLANPHAVFYAYETESLAYHYERNPDDPRLFHQLTLDVDEFGNVLKAVSVAYPRRAPPYPEQNRTLITYTENDVVNKPAEADWYRSGLPAETRSFELTGVAPANTLFTLDELSAAALAAAEIPYEATPGAQIGQKRLIERARTLYLKNALSASLPLAQVESLALAYESYKLAFTPGLLTQVFDTRVPGTALVTMLNAEGKYQDLDGDGHWWIPSGRAFYSPDPTNPDPTFAHDHFYLPQGSLDPFGNVTHITWDAHDQLLRQSEDAAHNVVSAQNDYRVTRPALVTDPNNNRAAVRFDALGQIVATAVMGKEGQNEGDTLDDPTTRLEYDLFNWQQNARPNFVHTFAREQHGAANPRWQESYSYSDGLGREVMKKIQAEPGEAPERDGLGRLVHNPDGSLSFKFTDARWVGTGRMVFDNKGNPIKKYEPFFDSSPAYEAETELAEWGVTPILRYDPLGRLIHTDFPNGTFSTVEFDAWQQIAADQNDAVLQSRWYAERGSPDPARAEPSDPETRAGWLAAQHANTPAVAHLDTLARAFMTIADNGAAGQYETRVELDIEGNQRSITDALNRQVMEYNYDMLSIKIHSRSVDAGERWLLNNVVGKPLRAWDSRDHLLRHEYDALLRPTKLFAQTGTGAEHLTERCAYGEGQPNDQGVNLRGKVYQLFDGAGIVTRNEYDFKGNLLNNSRQLLQNYKDEVDWSQPAALESETFSSATTYDALNRPVNLTTPDASVIRLAHNEANLLEQLNVSLRGAATLRAFVTNIDYNAKGQRELIEYGTGASTTYEYDPDTFRLVHLRTTRSSDSAVLQDLSYTFDPVGNITQIRDDAQETIFFNNQVVTASAAYVYDAIYRLTQATGREHIGQAGQPQTTWDDSPRLHQPQPTDGQAMRNYAEAYTYDAVGNIFALIHSAANGNWRRTYAYDEPNAHPANNRLTRTTVGSVKEQPYQYDAHGNMIQMPHLSVMDWDIKDQLHAIQQQVVNDGPGERTYYVYDAAGQRARKVTERASGAKKQERIYLSGLEVYREYSGDGGAVALERETLHVLDDNRRVAMVETKTADVDAPANTLPSTLIRYQFDNHLGSASLELDDGGALISYEEFYPYGSTSYQAGRSAAGVSLKRYRYTGKERDDETGLYYHGARYYAPWLGRWASTDPAGLAASANLYAYVGSNPLRAIDRTGQAEEDTSNVDVNKLAPSNQKLNALVNSELDKIRKELNITPGVAPTPEQRQKLVERISDLGMPRGGSNLSGMKAAFIQDASPNKTKIEKWAAQNLPVKQPGDKYASATYKQGLAWLVGPTAVNPSIVLEINGTGGLPTKIALGTDKLGHFFAQGYEYYEISVLQGKGDTMAIGYGIKMEEGKFGLGMTGVYSNADLEANKAGLQFYKDLYADPFMTFDIKKYATPKFSEKLNPNRYTTAMRQLLEEKGALTPREIAYENEFAVRHAEEVRRAQEKVYRRPGGVVQIGREY